MVIGWDIGGVNTKLAVVRGGEVIAARGRPYELQRAPGQLRDMLLGLAAEVGIGPEEQELRCGITMTAELSQTFRTKRDGVAFVLDAVEAAFPGASLHVFCADGRFVAPAQARLAPLDVAAANWAAAARLVATYHPDALLLDTGTTTTDVIPISGGQVRALGLTDPGRLASGELVYTGAVRTPAEAIAADVPFGGGRAGVSAEGFALAGDVHVWRGDLDPADYTWPTPDGRPPSRAFAGERLARVICADVETIDEAGITAIAGALADAQRDRIAVSIGRVLARHPSIRSAVVTGLGAFLAERAARAAGLDVVSLADELGPAAAMCAPASAVALLLERALRAAGDAAAGGRADLEGRPPATALAARPSKVSPARVDLVVKLGGGLLAHPQHFDAALRAIAGMARTRPLLVVPGGGAFADAVREADRRLGLENDTAHWMAVLAMDQYAHLVAARLTGARMVDGPSGLRAAYAAGDVPVLAPSRWLRLADPLPHSWDVTSDSIAAWVAGQVGAGELLLVKPPYASGDSLVDPHFESALPSRVRCSIVSADRLGPDLESPPAPAGARAL